jgi:uncharacterized membrane protein YdjX (TVP38/TMEM64 family)
MRMQGMNMMPLCDASSLFHSTTLDYTCPVLCAHVQQGPLGKFVGSLGWWGPIVYALLYAVCTLAFVPGSLLTVCAALLFSNFMTIGRGASLALSVAVVSVGSTAGACAAFAVGRTALGRCECASRTHTRAGHIAHALDSAIAERGFTTVLLLRLSPIIPFNILNYALALSRVRFIAYAAASWLGMLPATVLYVYIVWAIRNAVLSRGASITYDVLVYGVGSAATLALVLALTLVARNALRSISIADVKDAEDAEDAEVHARIIDS